MVRFIFFCMAVMALSLAAIPLINIADGIADQRAETLAAATQAVAPETTDAFAELPQEPSADTLNAIESAAGAGAPAQDTSTLSGGFGNTAPSALEDAEAQTTPVDPATPQDN